MTPLYSIAGVPNNVRQVNTPKGVFSAFRGLLEKYAFRMSAGICKKPGLTVKMLHGSIATNLSLCFLKSSLHARRRALPLFVNLVLQV